MNPLLWIPKQFSKGLLCLFLCCLLSTSYGQLAYPECEELAPTDFERKILISKAQDITLDEPLRIKIDGKGRLFVILKNGEMWMLDATKNFQKSVVGTIDVYKGKFFGLVGLALAKDFLTSGYLYTIINIRDKPNIIYRLSRFKMVGEKLDTSSQKTILEWVHTTGEGHMGTDIFLAEDNILYIPTGNDAWAEGTPRPSTNESRISHNALRTSGNTNDLRGKILKIKLMVVPDSHPKDSWGEGITYTIPSGNLFPPGTPKTRPEIFSMGLRNPFSIHVEDGTVYIADVGPQGRASTPEGASGGDQFYITKEPANFGHPMFVDGFRPNSIMNEDNTLPVGTYDVNLPINTSKFNTGRDTLPIPKPAAAVSHWEQALNVNGWFKSGAVSLISGPIYHYTNIASTVKFPPHFDGKWITADFMKHIVRAISLNGETVTDVQTLFTDMTIKNPVDMEFGIDGSLFLIEYSGYVSSNLTTQISNITYTGNCLPKITGLKPGELLQASDNRVQKITFTPGQSISIPEDFLGVKIYNVSGEKIWEQKREDSRTITLPQNIGEGLLFMQYE